MLSGSFTFKFLAALLSVLPDSMIVLITWFKPSILQAMLPDLRGITSLSCVSQCPNVSSPICLTLIGLQIGLGYRRGELLVHYAGRIMSLNTSVRTVSTWVGYQPSGYRFAFGWCVAQLSSQMQV